MDHTVCEFAFAALTAAQFWAVIAVPLLREDGARDGGAGTPECGVLIRSPAGIVDRTACAV
jgi:hypothetical protein